VSRIRSIKPEWLDSEKMVELSDQARLASVALLALADDWGNCPGNPQQVAARIWPLAEDRLERMTTALKELEQAGYLTPYQVNGRSYIHIQGWFEHQKVDKPGRPRFPFPPGLRSDIPERKLDRWIAVLDKYDIPRSTLTSRGQSDDSEKIPATPPTPVREDSRTFATDRDLDRDLDPDQEVDPRGGARESPPPPKLPSENWDPPTHPEGVWRLLVNACKLAGLPDPGDCGGIRRLKAQEAMQRVDPKAMPDDFREWAKHVRSRDKPPSKPWLNYCDHWGSWAKQNELRESRASRGRTVVPSADETNRLIEEREAAYRADRAKQRGPSEPTSVAAVLTKTLAGGES